MVVIVAIVQALIFAFGWLPIAGIDGTRPAQEPSAVLAVLSRSTLFIGLGVALLGIVFQDRFSRRAVLAVGTVTLLVAMGLGSVHADATLSALSYVVAAVSGGILLPSSMAVIVEQVGPGRRGLVMGMASALAVFAQNATVYAVTPPGDASWGHGAALPWLRGAVVLLSLGLAFALWRLPPGRGGHDVDAARGSARWLFEPKEAWLAYVLPGLVTVAGGLAIAGAMRYRLASPFNHLSAPVDERLLVGGLCLVGLVIVGRLSDRFGALHVTLRALAVGFVFVSCLWFRTGALAALGVVLFSVLQWVLRVASFEAVARVAGSGASGRFMSLVAAVTSLVTIAAQWIHPAPQSVEELHRPMSGLTIAICGGLVLAIVAVLSQLQEAVREPREDSSDTELSGASPPR
ncbi:MFS transporter [Myxococcaceae bacterium JPH2]|nr:MFS transporter [Myxococcaceae bacterium JPH2]